MRSSDAGGIVLEAALTLPFFALLMLGFVSLVQLAVADVALRSAVSETVKTVAANMYPVRLLYSEAKARVESTKPAQAWNAVAGRIQDAHGNVQTAEQFVEQYAAYIPGPIVQIVNAEKQLRTALEDEALDRVDGVKQQVSRTVAREAVTPILASFADTSILKRERLQVTDVDWPVPDDPEQAWIGIEAAYEMRLALPFFTRTVVLKKKALERCWIGNG
ncbi:hypothetical protein SD70_15205 [Gordoniibacillus kamchatkensis]|uniref:TadE-like protein n=1 Tax=Gordoniibacillus kamchatkensis TaxID=1590651 RepID=A0ABR5AGR2_9BACL|nr:hypothetical protein [Paenibacillus sp. VKM B-2647]KIL40219.1 hypothetical protein SD70_15205 [Paenibacillus sp. VKM B-2647]